MWRKRDGTNGLTNQGVFGLKILGTYMPAYKSTISGNGYAANGNGNGHSSAGASSSSSSSHDTGSLLADKRVDWMKVTFLDRIFLNT